MTAKRKQQISEPRAECLYSAFPLRVITPEVVGEMAATVMPPPVLLRLRGVFEVGGPYPTTQPRGADSVGYGYDRDHHFMPYILTGLDRALTAVAGQARVSLGLYSDNDIMLLLHRIPGLVDWSDVQYSYHLALPQHQFLPSPDQVRMSLVFVRAEDHIVAATRTGSVSSEFAQAFHDAVATQSQQPWDPSRYRRRLTELYARYPRSQDLLPLCSVRCELRG